MNPSAHDIAWPAGPIEPSLAPDEVHVWAASLSVPTAVLAALSITLSAEERERAARFKFDLHRNRFIVGRGILRELLGRYTGANPEELDFAYADHGKPQLTSGSDLQFNLAHSDDIGLFAFSRHGPLGVDVEQVRRINNVDDLVARFFSARENDLFQKLSDDQKPGAFFNLWTRKEALLKATGEGITGGLNRVEVTFLEDEAARLLAIDGNPVPARDWILSSLAPAPGFVGAVAVQSTHIKVSCWRKETELRI